MKRAIFLDRDGIINKKPAPHDYVKDWSEFKFLPGIEKLIKRANKKGYLVIIATNQRGIARGLMTKKDLHKIHQKMKEELKRKGAKIDEIYYCLHNLEKHCQCRKPKPGLLLQAAKDFNLNLQESILIGDDETDILAGKAAGCKTILVKSYQDYQTIRF